MDFKERYLYDSKTDLLGKGGFAMVYKAKDVLLDRTVALKFFSASGDDKHTLIKEISRAISLEHPNLCRYYDATMLEQLNLHGEVDKTEVGVMEYLDGGDLKTYWKAHPEQQLKLLTDVLKGLSFLHKWGIIHRDLKPANILIKNTEEGPVAKITDFGISKDVGSNHTSSSLLMGTIEYMAPEQFSPAKYGIEGKIGTNLDLWSFGLMVYELVTGGCLFGSRGGDSSAEQVMGNILSSDLFEDKISKLPEPYLSVVKRCLVKDAKQRVQRADELIALMEGKPVSQDIEQALDTQVLLAPVTKTEVLGSADPETKPILSGNIPLSGKGRSKKLKIVGIAGILFLVALMIFLLRSSWLVLPARSDNVELSKDTSKSALTSSPVLIASKTAIKGKFSFDTTQVVKHGVKINFIEDFSDTTHFWSVAEGATIADGKLRYKFLEKGQTSILTPVLLFSLNTNKDFSISVRTKWISGADDVSFGIQYFMDTGGLNRCEFSIAANGAFSIGTVKNGKWEPLQNWKNSEHINKNSLPNILDIVKKGNYISFYINDNQVASFPFEGGYVGTAYGVSVSASQTVEFDDFKISGTSL